LKKKAFNMPPLGLKEKNRILYRKEGKGFSMEGVLLGRGGKGNRNCPTPSKVNPALGKIKKQTGG